ncbi:dolichol phosphate-mannose biosynthesis regulatory [Cokeromyces recurvatus]|uniref:dolichol phosphate-mannose biosynthesis regulatory n=1 Tax=Cokeromyces recurvatus TaxID=90255 RepID=UPI00221FA2AE|nr:dolichol phosphate-mannose biosynthesis regulatory [Cokeromyces recurvatus]KAI7907444.1 dolichol phosphate-mannose biosynthesis regulatory [Cokeromyces recurvatus]
MSTLDRLVGGAAFAAAMFIFIYFTTWTFVTPFLDENSSLQKYFLPHEFAIYLPATLLIAGISVIIAFFIKATSQSKNKQKAK